VRDLLKELLEFVDDVVDELGSRQDINHIYTMIENGNSADRQLKVWKENDGDMRAVVRALAKETIEGVM